MQFFLDVYGEDIIGWNKSNKEGEEWKTKPVINSLLSKELIDIRTKAFEEKWPISENEES